MTEDEARQRALSTFEKRYGPSKSALEFRRGDSPRSGKLVPVFDAEDRMLVGYACENRERLTQVHGPKRRPR